MIYSHIIQWNISGHPKHKLKIRFFLFGVGFSDNDEPDDGNLKIVHFKK
jgi:hypothetical protein